MLMRALETDNAPVFDKLLAVTGDRKVDLTAANESGHTIVTIASYLPDRDTMLDRVLGVALDRSMQLLVRLLSMRTDEADGRRTALMYAIDSENTQAAKVLLKYYKIIFLEAARATEEEQLASQQFAQRSVDEMTVEQEDSITRDKQQPDPHLALPSSAVRLPVHRAVSSNEAALRLIEDYCCSNSAPLTIPVAEALVSIKSSDDATALTMAIEERVDEVVDALVDLLSKDALKAKWRGKSVVDLALHAARETDPDEGAASETVTAGDVPVTEQKLLPEATVEKIVDARYKSELQSSNDAGDVDELTTYLTVARKYNLFSVVTRLLYQGARAQDLFTAAAAGDIEFFQEHRRKAKVRGERVDVNAVESGSTYLMLACRSGSFEFVEYLLSVFGEPSQWDPEPAPLRAGTVNRENGEPAILTAARHGHIAIVKRLLRWAEKTSTAADVAGERLNIDAQAKDGTTVLMALAAVTTYDSTSAKELLETADSLGRVLSNLFKARLREERGGRAPNPIKIKQRKKEWANLMDDTGENAIQIAVRRQNIELATSLRLSWGAAVGLRSATVLGSISELRTLLDSVSNMSGNVDQREYLTALHLACRSTEPGSDAKASLLLERGADPSVQTKAGWTALMYACREADADGKIATVQALLDAGADYDLQNSDGATALILTLKDRSPFSPRQVIIAAMLVRAGADLHRTDASGYTALDDCAKIAGEALRGLLEGGTNTNDIFATMLHRGVHLDEEQTGVAVSQRDVKQAAQRGFVLPNFSIREMREGIKLRNDRTINTLLQAYATMESDELARCSMMSFTQDGLYIALVS